MVLRYKEEGLRGKESGSGFAGTPNNVGAEAVKRFLLRFGFIANIFTFISITLPGST